jgi:hypothetical protein
MNNTTNTYRFRSKSCELDFTKFYDTNNITSLFTKKLRANTSLSPNSIEYKELVQSIYNEFLVNNGKVDVKFTHVKESDTCEYIETQMTDGQWMLFNLCMGDVYKVYKS